MEDVRELDYRDLKEGDVVWACAYRTNNTEKSMALKQKPIQGIIMNTKKTSRYGGWSKLSFVPYNAKGKPIMSKAVSISARTYTRTEKDATIIYNRYVQYQIDTLQRLLDECKADLI